MKGIKIPEKTREDVLNAIRMGFPYKDIARQLNISRRSVNSIALENGIQIHKKKRSVGKPDCSFTDDRTDDIPEVVSIPDGSIPAAILDALTLRLYEIQRDIEQAQNSIVSLKKQESDISSYLLRNGYAYLLDEHCKDCGEVEK